MKKLLALILFVLVIFAACKKADTDSNNVSEQENSLKIADEKIEIEPIVAIEPEPNPLIGVITDTRVRLRSEPNLESETLEFLNTGDKLIILDKSAEQQQIDTMIDYWYKVQLDGYPDGWVYGAFVDYEIVWVERAIEYEVREMLDKADGVIMKSDLDDITKFSTERGNIRKFDDVAHFKNVTRLAISMTNASDISPLSGLSNLTTLILVLCDISDLSPLRNLTNLTELRLGGNEISDLSPLSDLTNLIILDLSANQINDISALSTLPNLAYLDLGNTGDYMMSSVGNKINDIRPLGKH